MSSRGFFCIQGFETSSERRKRSAAGFGSNCPVDSCVKREENPLGENSAIFAEAHDQMKVGRCCKSSERRKRSAAGRNKKSGAPFGAPDVFLFA